jgi:dTDP-4-dehydrorhamnose 3,5-epimerase-like enzyme
VRFVATELAGMYIVELEERTDRLRHDDPALSVEWLRLAADVSEKDPSWPPLATSEGAT